MRTDKPMMASFWSSQSGKFPTVPASLDWWWTGWTEINEGCLMCGYAFSSMEALRLLQAGFKPSHPNVMPSFWAVATLEIVFPAPLVGGPVSCVPCPFQASERGPFRWCSISSGFLSPLALGNSVSGADCLRWGSASVCTDPQDWCFAQTSTE